MPARSYLVRGMYESQPRWMDVYEGELQRVMEQVMSSADGTGS
jgi:hypothetical protein